MLPAMAFPPFITATALAAALLAACVSNPTPHPGGPDAFGPDSSVTVVPTPPEDDQRGVCDGLGGVWDSADSACVDLDSGFEANTGAGGVPTGPPAADLLAVAVEGDPQAYTFTVSLQSSGEGCVRYADWWEVVRVDQTLAYRHVISGPSLAVQNAIYTGGPVAIGPDDLVVVRAHLHPDGYVGLAWVGSVRAGFTAARVAPEFAASVANEAPQPPPCNP